MLNGHLRCVVPDAAFVSVVLHVHVLVDLDVLLEDAEVLLGVDSADTLFLVGLGGRLLPDRLELQYRDRELGIERDVSFTSQEKSSSRVSVS